MDITFTPKITHQRPTVRVRRATNTCRSLLREARVAIVILFALRTITASALPFTPTAAKLCLVIGWVAITMTVYLANGLSDIATDRANASPRPLATGQLSVRTTQHACVLLAIVGLFTLASIGQLALTLGLISLAIGLAYSIGPTLKNSPSGSLLTVAAGAALSYLAGASLNHLSGADGICLMLWSAWIGLSAATKDLSDIEGDSQSGRRTLAVKLSTRALALSVLLGGAVLVIALTVTIGFTDTARAPAAAAAILGAAYLSLTVARSHTVNDRRSARAPYRAFLTAQFAFNAAWLLSCLHTH